LIIFNIYIWHIMANFLRRMSIIHRHPLFIIKFIDHFVSKFSWLIRKNPLILPLLN
jgi:hypothetical protein